MKIGIVGTGNMGSSLGILLAKQGHQVFFGARDQAKAEAAAALAGAGARSGSNQEAANFGEVLVWGVRGVAAAEVVADLKAVLGKPIIDMNNNETRTDGGIGPTAASVRRTTYRWVKSCRPNSSEGTSSRRLTPCPWRCLRLTRRSSRAGK